MLEELMLQMEDLREQFKNSQEMNEEKVESSSQPESAFPSQRAQFEWINSNKNHLLGISRFDGQDPEGWLYQAAQFFSYCSTPYDQQLRMYKFHLKGWALRWYQWVEKSRAIHDWPDFASTLVTRFRPTEFEIAWLFQQSSANLRRWRLARLIWNSSKSKRSI